MRTVIIQETRPDTILLLAAYIHVHPYMNHTLKVGPDDDDTKAAADVIKAYSAGAAHFKLTLHWYNVAPHKNLCKKFG